ncbi:hypothetical protein Tco_0849338 [Tanacetum coccineum]
MWSMNTFKCTDSKWGVVLHVDDQEDGSFHRKRMCIKMKVEINIFESFKIIFHDSKGEDVGLKTCSIFREDSDVEEVPETKLEECLHKSNTEEASVGQIDMHSEDPFKIYDLLNKKKEDINKGPSLENSLKYPPGFMPTDNTEEQGKKNDESKKESGNCSHKGSKKGSKEVATESICLGHFKKSEIPRTAGSILHLMDELVKVGQTMGYNMEGCMKNMEEIIQSQEVNDGFDKLVEDTWKETPMEESNAVINMMKKLKYLKQKIREWNNDKKKSAKNSKTHFKEELADLDTVIYKG